MADIEVKIPAMGESISEGTISRWFKKEGEAVKADEALFEIETDKVTQEIYAPASGVVKKLTKAQGANASVGEVVAIIDPSATATTTAAPAAAPAQPAPTPAAPAPQTASSMTQTVPPAAKKIALENNIDTATLQGSGKHGQVTKGDVLAAVAAPGRQTQPDAPTAPRQPAPSLPRGETVQPMSRLRRAIAERLVSAQQTAAILTTFNEVDMKPAMDLRAKHNDEFQKRYGVKIGFMSLFTKAVVAALQEIPAINAEIRGSDVVYKNYYDIGVAVGLSLIHI